MSEHVVIYSLWKSYSMGLTIYYAIWNVSTTVFPLNELYYSSILWYFLEQEQESYEEDKL